MHHEQIFKFLGCIKICKDSTWTKTRRNKIMQPITSNNDSRPVFRYHVYNQADFDNPFINWRRFMFWHYKDEFHFYIFTAVQDSILIKAARKANIWWHSYYCSSWKSCFKFLNLKSLEPKGMWSLMTDSHLLRLYQCDYCYYSHLGNPRTDCYGRFLDI